jgi:hypothetical protein
LCPDSQAHAALQNTTLLPLHCLAKYVEELFHSQLQTVTLHTAAAAAAVPYPNDCKAQEGGRSVVPLDNRSVTITR